MGIFKKANNIYITVRDTYTSISGSSYEEAEEIIIEATNGDLELVSQKKVIMQGLGNGESDNKSKKTQLLVTKVKGKNTAIPYEEVTYKVTKYNQDKVSENDKKRIQWAIKIDGEQEILKEKGDKLVLTLKEEWVGKEIIVMPFLRKATQKVCVKTDIREEKWFLPRVLIQTKTYEGFGLKSERDIYEYQDANGNGLTRHKPTDPIAEDMHYGSAGVHTDNFKLSQIKDKDVLENIQELNQYPTEYLFALFKNLIEWTSKGDLETNNLQMVNSMRYGTKQYQDPILTKAVFNHENTKKFVENITNTFIEIISNNEGNLNNVIFKKPDKLRRPSFSTLNDRMEGLTIALNDTWGFRVTITKYSYHPQTKDVEVTLKFRIIDHFGLDVADIESYGSARKIITKNWKAAPLANNMAQGFCSWFILQHLRGYKPFITIMEKEQTLKFKI